MTERERHSMSVFRLGADCVWVLVFGGVGYMADTSIIELSEHCSIVRIKGASKDQLLQDVRQLQQQVSVVRSRYS